MHRAGSRICKRQGTILPWNPLREDNPARFQTSGLQNHENKFVLRCQVCGNLYSCLRKLTLLITFPTLFLSVFPISVADTTLHPPRPDTWGGELINIMYWVLRMYPAYCWVHYVHSSHLILILTQPSTGDTVICHFRGTWGLRRGSGFYIAPSGRTQRKTQV